VTRLFERQSFRGLSDRDSGAVFEDLEFRRCSFFWCGLSTTFDPRRRSTVRRVHLVGCEQRNCRVGAAILDEVIVDGLKTHGVLQAWAPVFRHVTLRGRIGQLMVSPYVEPVSATPAQQRAFDEANAAFYAGVDWALDISEAEFDYCELGAVPGALVRRDPATQVLVTRERALQGVWRTLDLAGTWWDIALQHLLDGRMSAHVLVAPRRHPRYQRLLDGLKLLRDAGVAEPD